MDHALSRRERGLAGFLLVEIPENPEVSAGRTERRLPRAVTEREARRRELMLGVHDLSVVTPC